MLVDASLRNNAWLFEKWKVGKKNIQKCPTRLSSDGSYIHFLLKTNMFLPCAIASLESCYNFNFQHCRNVSRRVNDDGTKETTPSPSTRAESSVKREKWVVSSCTTMTSFDVDLHSLNRESNECKSASLSLESFSLLYSFNSSGFSFRCCCTFFSLHMHTRARVAGICMWKERAWVCERIFHLKKKSRTHRKMWARAMMMMNGESAAKVLLTQKRPRNVHSNELQCDTIAPCGICLITLLRALAQVSNFGARENCIKSQISGWIVLW